jgi:predicted transcriptional regulator
VERARAIFVDGIGAAAATSDILTQLQGRIFGLVYLEPRPLSLDQIAADLQQSKSNVSVNIRGLVDWQLVRRVSVAGSRKDHYEAAADFWQAMQEIMERRFRWNLRQIIATSEETEPLCKGAGVPPRRSGRTSSPGSTPCTRSLPPSMPASVRSRRGNPPSPTGSKTSCRRSRSVPAGGDLDDAGGT